MLIFDNGTIGSGGTSWTFYVDDLIQTNNIVSAKDAWLFASQYEAIAGASSEPYFRSKEDGDVIGFSSGTFTNIGGFGADSTVPQQRQGYGLRFSALNAGANDYFGMTFKAPANSNLDISGADRMVIQTGNGASKGINSHNIYTIEMSGNSNSANQLCAYDLVLDPAIQGTGAYGFRVYAIELTEFTCSQGTLSELKNSLTQVTLKVVGNKDSRVKTNILSVTLMEAGYITFSGSTKVSSVYKTFASAKHQASGAEIFTIEGGLITEAVSSTKFKHIESLSQVKNNQAMAYFAEYENIVPVGSSDSFSVNIQAPGNGSLNISNSNMLIAQIGNAALDKDEISHDILTIELSNNANVCSIDQNVADARIGKDGSHVFGLRTYYIPLTNLNCSSGNLTNLQADLQQVSVKVIGGKSAVASSTTGTNAAIGVGNISFK